VTVPEHPPSRSDFRGGRGFGPAAKSGLPRSVKLLGWTSLFTDAASEAIYPLLPIFVTRVLGGNALSLGMIEGAADAMSSLLKILAGRASDRLGRRKPFVVIGYCLAGAVRPLMALASTWPQVFAVRVSDRIGKGLRGAPRDAMLGAFAPEGQRGRVFGYHRAMDHAGAVLGPLAAASFLWFFPGEYRLLFALTIVPGALAVAMLALVPDVRPGGPSGPGRPGRAGATSASGAPETRGMGAEVESIAAQSDQAYPAYQAYPAQLKRFLFILALFTLGNSTDAFLLLRLSDAGLATVYLPIVWAGLHVVKSGLSTAGGALSDRFGRKHLIIAGWVLYAIVYLGFAMNEALLPLLGWFFVYGVHFALVEGSEKALVADLTPQHLHGTAFGWYNAVLGFGALGASLFFGALWETFGPRVAFLSGAGLALTAAVLLAADRQLASRS
jgi:MFS family permease